MLIKYNMKIEVGRMKDFKKHAEGAVFVVGRGILLVDLALFFQNR